MPSHKIHLAIAKKINDKLNLNLDCVMLGSILPDICNEKNHNFLIFKLVIKILKAWQIQINLFKNIKIN